MMRLLLWIAGITLCLNQSLHAGEKERNGESCWERCTEQGKQTFKSIELVGRPVNHHAIFGNSDTKMAREKEINAEQVLKYNNACAGGKFGEIPGNIHWCKKHCETGGKISTWQGRPKKAQEFIASRTADCGFLKEEFSGTHSFASLEKDDIAVLKAQ